MTEEAALLRIDEPDLSGLSRAELRAMLAAGEEVAECHRVLARGGLNVVGEVLRGQGQFIRLNHYPKGDVYDRDSHAQYYYHAHRGGEHGHFHTFLRAAGMPPGVRPAPENAGRDWPSGEKALAHIVAISMDKRGFPTRMFTTNRWVTGETWYAAEDVVAMIDRFEIDHANPSWPTNRWITAMMRLFRPQVKALVLARDAVIAGRRQQYPERDTLDDRTFETVTEIDIDPKAQTDRIRAALG